MDNCETHVKKEILVSLIRTKKLSIELHEETIRSRKGSILIIKIELEALELALKNLSE